MNFTSFEQTVERAREAFAVPAVSAAVIKDGEIIYENGFGTRTMGEDRPVDADTVYAIASMSKSMTATVLMMEKEAGHLDLNTRVSDYLPEFELMDPFASREMTVRDLLLHRSGLRSEAGGLLWYGSERSKTEVMKRMRYLRPKTSFRSTYDYQNIFFMTAGLVLEAVTGKTWEENLQTRLFDPLGMKRTTPTHAEMIRHWDGNVASPHAPVEGIQQHVPYRNHDNCGPAASVNSTAHDIAQYLRMYLRKGADLLKPESVDELISPFIYAPDDYQKEIHPRLIPKFPMYGYGWHSQDYCGFREVYHSGGVDGMRCRMAFFPEKNCGCVVLTNCEDRSAYTSLMLTLYDMLLGVEPLDWVSLFAAQPPEKQPQLPPQIPGTTPRYSVDEILGLYYDTACEHIAIMKVGGTPMLRFRHSPVFTATLTHYHYDTWRLNWCDRYIPDGLLTIVPGPTGEIAGIHFDQPDLLDVHFDELDPVIRRIEIPEDMVLSV